MSQLIVALDLPSVSQAMTMASILRGQVQWLKIGLELFIYGGPKIVCDLKNQGFRIFLDLKFYDIPHTVECAVKAASSLGVDILTIHCQGGEKMCRAALMARNNNSKPLLFGVTALTSFAAGEMPGISEPPEVYAKKLAGDADKCGLDGIVCSGLEVKNIKKNFPSLLALCPGIRPNVHNAEDQARIVTPMQAVRNGADFLVIGRPVLASEDPAEAVSEILSQMNQA